MLLEELPDGGVVAGGDVVEEPAVGAVGEDGVAVFAGVGGFVGEGCAAIGAVGGGDGIVDVGEGGGAAFEEEPGINESVVGIAARGAGGGDGVEDAGPADFDEDVVRSTGSGRIAGDDGEGIDGADAGIEVNVAEAAGVGGELGGVFFEEGGDGDFADGIDAGGAVGLAETPVHDGDAVFEVGESEVLIALQERRKAGDGGGAHGMPFAGLGDFGEDPIVLAAAEGGFAIGAVGVLVDGHSGAAVGAVAFHEPGGDRFGAAAAKEGPVFGERFGGIGAVTEFAFGGDVLIDGGGMDADGGGVEAVIGGDLGHGDGLDADVFHEVVIAEVFLFTELEGEGFDDGIGDEGAYGGEILVGPGGLEGEEGGGDAGEEGGGIEGGVGFFQLIDGDGGEVGTGDRRAHVDGIMAWSRRRSCLRGIL